MGLTLPIVCGEWDRDQSMAAKGVIVRYLTGDEWWRPMPPGTSVDAVRILAGRGIRAFGDGFVALLLPVYLIELGFNAFAIGSIVTTTLIDTAFLTLWVGMTANRHSRRRLLLAAAALMAATGAAFAVNPRTQRTCSVI